MSINKLEILSICFLIVTLLLVLSLHDESNLYILRTVKSDVLDLGILSNPSDKNIIMYNSLSSGCCPSQKLEIEENLPNGTPIIKTDLGSSVFKIKIPPKSITNTTDVVVTPSIGRRNRNKPVLAEDIVDTVDFLNYYVTERKINPYGSYFNPDWYLTTQGISIPEIIKEKSSMPPTFQIIYSHGTCQRYYWSGYIKNINWGSLYDGVSSYEIEVEGTIGFDNKFNDTYLFNHKDPTSEFPHFHQEPRINGVNNQKLITGTGISSWAITIGESSINPFVVQNVPECQYLGGILCGTSASSSSQNKPVVGDVLTKLANGKIKKLAQDTQTVKAAQQEAGEAGGTTATTAGAATTGSAATDTGAAAGADAATDTGAVAGADVAATAGADVAATAGAAAGADAGAIVASILPELLCTIS